MILWYVLARKKSITSKFIILFLLLPIYKAIRIEHSYRSNYVLSYILTKSTQSFVNSVCCEDNYETAKNCAMIGTCKL